MHTPNFDFKFSMARAGTELCGLCLGILGFKLIVGFLMLQCPVALLGIRCLHAFALLSLRHFYLTMWNFGHVDTDR